MRPIMLNGHERALTKIKYNRDGDLLFSVAKDNKPTVWYSHNGERLGTYVGHQGACWDIAVSDDSQKLLTGAGDNTCKLWNVNTGECLYTWNTKSGVRSVDFAMGGKLALFVTDATMGQPSMIHVYEIAEDSKEQSDEPIYTITIPKGSKATIARFGYLNKYILVGHDDGTISKWDAESGDLLQKTKPHQGQIQDLQFSKKMDMYITASKDFTAKLFDAESMEELKKYPTERNVNGAAISPLRAHIILGGGQEAMSVTTTRVNAGKFEVRLFHQVFEEEIGRIKGHFGPINTVAFHPSGKGFASGGEDGYIRLHEFDPDYFKFKYDEEELLDDN